MSKDLKIKKITNFLPFLAKNGIFCEMSTENDQKPLNMGYFEGFMEKNQKKIDTYFGNHVRQNA